LIFYLYQAIQSAASLRSHVKPVLLDEQDDDVDFQPGLPPHCVSVGLVPRVRRDLEKGVVGRRGISEERIAPRGQVLHHVHGGHEVLPTHEGITGDGLAMVELAKLDGGKLHVLRRQDTWSTWRYNSNVMDQI
jgi:hypothetical protein